MGLRVQISKETEKRFREAARRRYGNSKGALSNAAEDAFQSWLAVTQDEPKFRGDPVKAIEGILEEIKIDSVDLQNASTRLWLKNI